MNDKQNSTPKHVAILGFDREGRASYDFFTARGDIVTICDQQPDKIVPDGAQAVLGDKYLDDLDRFDLLVRTPGLKPGLILDKNPQAGNKITSGTNEFFKACPSQNIIGVTGTKGKGTTSTLIAKMLAASGKTVHLAGNIGDAMLALIPQIRPDDWIVLELSSFQLADTKHSPHLAVCLMITPEHLDTHGSFEKYLTAKEQLFARQLPGDVAIYYYNSPDSKKIASAGEGQKVPYFHSPGAEIADGNIVIDGRNICATSELALPGEHNWQNACAAVTAVWYAAHSVVGPETEPDFEAIRHVLTTFSGLPYRIEFRREVNGVRYYNDSFASVTSAVPAALQSISGKKVLIVGGFDRGLALNELAGSIKSHANDLRSVIIIGAAKARIAQALADAQYNNVTISEAQTMDEIVQQANSVAQAGDAVVLSPGFPSFDMFKNFEDRGQQFNQTVGDL
jgi:UDP-N-acetylmuramoylalanine--D-glutamate ligase